jgi:hypothetical protein
MTRVIGCVCIQIKDLFTERDTSHHTSLGTVMNLIQQRNKILQARKNTIDKERKKLGNLMIKLLGSSEPNYYHIIFIRFRRQLPHTADTKEFTEEFADLFWFLLQKSGHKYSFKQVKEWVSNRTSQPLDGLSSQVIQRLDRWKSLIITKESEVKNE